LHQAEELVADPTDGHVIQLSSALNQDRAFAFCDDLRWHTLKRGFDIVAVLIILAIVAPVMLTIWILELRDGGQPFYGQMRVGRGGRPFRCLKFRSMVPDADAKLRDLLVLDPDARDEWNRSFKLVTDPRVTRLGKILRATSFDELPQFFNILRGDMSLVGPRPVVPSELEQFYRGEARQAYLSVRPGLTGLWQVSGRSDSSYDRRVELDTEYVKKASLRQDLAILRRTVVAVLLRRGAY
jgi:lipopolysaccharide/colanic/teichoic acid biosynthesis glycosyltransferase